jgi:hypothetical protein
MTVLSTPVRQKANNFQLQDLLFTDGRSHVDSYFHCHDINHHFRRGHYYGFRSDSNLACGDIWNPDHPRVSTPNHVSPSSNQASKTTSTITKINTHTKKVHSDTTSTSTTTITPHCTTTSSSPKKPDATKPAAKAEASSSSHAPTPSPTNPAKQPHGRRSAALSARLARRAQLVKRDGPDGPLTTTVVETAAPVVQTVLAPASTVTETDTVEVVQTSTVTPPPATVLSGTVAATVTSTMTVFKTTRSSSAVTSTVFETQKAVMRATLLPNAC